ncbi:MAG: hypothetical protein MJD61_00970, partial [Proteobacteria bacterium]|nr:hypothetical protein [Pseudomonadota bacterium]
MSRPTPGDRPGLRAEDRRGRARRWFCERDAPPAFADDLTRVEAWGYPGGCGGGGSQLEPTGKHPVGCIWLARLTS